MRPLTEQETHDVSGGVTVRPDKPYWNPYTDPKSMPGDEQDQKYWRYEQMIRFILKHEGHAIPLADGNWMTSSPGSTSRNELQRYADIYDRFGIVPSININIQAQPSSGRIVIRRPDGSEVVVYDTDDQGNR